MDVKRLETHADKRYTSVIYLFIYLFIMVGGKMEMLNCIRLPLNH